MNLIQSGRTLVYRIADFDSNDKYNFILLLSEYSSDPIGFFWNLYGSGDSGRLGVTKDAMANATSLARFSQGSVSDGSSSPTDDKLTRSTPPFLLSRGAFAELREKGSVVLDFPQKGSSISRRKTSEFTLPSTNITVKTIEAGGPNLDMVIVDDPNWPVVLRATFEDDNEIALVGLTGD